MEDAEQWPLSGVWLTHRPFAPIYANLMIRTTEEDDPFVSFGRYMEHDLSDNPKGQWEILDTRVKGQFTVIGWRPLPHMISQHAKSTPAQSSYGKPEPAESDAQAG